jgi:putative endonuclease
MFYVYILRSLKDNKFYIGYSIDLRKRFNQHNNGLVKSTIKRRPFELVYYEAFKYEKDARKQELFYKTGQGRRVLKSRLQSILEE